MAVKKKHDCKVDEKLKDEANGIIKRLSKKKYCITEIAIILKLAELRVGLDFNASNIIDSLSIEIAKNVEGELKNLSVEKKNHNNN